MCWARTLKIGRNRAGTSSGKGAVFGQGQGFGSSLCQPDQCHPLLRSVCPLAHNSHAFLPTPTCPHSTLLNPHPCANITQSRSSSLRRSWNQHGEASVQPCAGLPDSGIGENFPYGIFVILPGGSRDLPWPKSISGLPTKTSFCILQGLHNSCKTDTGKKCTFNLHLF